MTIHKRRGFVLLAIVMVTIGTGWLRAQPPPVAPTTPTTGQPAVGSPAAEAPITRPSDVQGNQPAVPTINVPSSAEPEHAPEQAMWGLIGVFALQWLKKTKWFPFLTDETTGRAKAIWGFMLALFTAVSINVAVQGSVWDRSGAAITFSGVSFDAFKDVAWQWAINQAWFRALIQGVGPVVGRG